MDETPNEESFTAIQIDESLEDRLQAHGITRRNIRSIIHGIFSDENVLRLLKDADSAPELDLPEARITRSRKCQNEMVEFDISNGFDDLDSDLLFSTCYNEGSSPELAHCDTTLDSSGDVVDINTESCLDENGEFNWQTWLSEFDNCTKDNKSKDADGDSDNDPDYDFLEELEEQDDEDYRDDRLTRISKKELVDLTKKGKRRKNPTFNGSIATEQRLVIPQESTLPLKPESRQSVTKAIDVFWSCRTMKEKLQMMRHDPALKSIAVARKKRKVGKVKSSFLTFSETQLKTVKMQMQQHVQLLTQSCVLGWGQEDCVSTVATFLHEIELFKFQSPCPDTSSFHVAMAHEALNIAKLVETLSRNCPCENCDIVDILANSKVFMYKELLPKFICPVSSHAKKTVFSFHEDSLIAHGLSEMSGFYTSPAELISLLILPVRSKEEINSRIKTAMRGNTRRDIPNPIVNFKMFRTLPPPCIPVDLPDTESAIPPIQMVGQLPKWLIDLQMEEKRSPSHTNSIKIKEGLCRGFRIGPSKKYSARNLKKTDSGNVALFWTREMDEKILSICKHYNGPNKEALFLLSYEFPIRTPKQIENRFNQLMKIYRRSISKKRMGNNLLNLQEK